MVVAGYTQHNCRPTAQQTCRTYKGNQGNLRPDSACFAACRYSYPARRLQHATPCGADARMQTRHDGVLTLIIAPHRQAVIDPQPQGSGDPFTARLRPQLPCGAKPTPWANLRLTDAFARAEIRSSLAVTVCVGRWKELGQHFLFRWFRDQGNHDHRN